MRPLRRLLLVDTGELVDPYYAKNGSIISIPDVCKRINSRVTIVGVGSKCDYFVDKDIGKECLISVDHHEDYRIKPRLSKKCKLRRTWHMFVPEVNVDLVFES